jgi:hypothetical protein
MTLEPNKVRFFTRSFSKSKPRRNPKMPKESGFAQTEERKSESFSAETNGHEQKDFDHHFRRHQAGTYDQLLGVTVKSILLKTPDHIVFIDENTNLQWECSKEQEIRHCYPQIANRVASLVARSEFLRRAHSSAFLRMTCIDNDLNHARSLIAQGIIQVLVGGKESEQTVKHANAVLDTAEAWIKQRATEVSRLWYFRPFGILFLVSFVVFLVYLTFYSIFPKNIGWALTYACIAAGGVGAFISAAIGCERRIPSAASAGPRLHTLEAVVRWSVGLSAGALVYMLSQSDLPFLKNLPGSEIGTVALALIAGASERFFPSFIKKLEDPELKKS